ncbi:MAG: hypothetical protein AAF563_19675 [Pseudomonadota bacterium]
MLNPFVRHCAILLGTAVLALMVAQVSHAESRGAYVHGDLREGDEKLIVCRGRDLAVSLSEGVNQALVDMLDMLVAASDDDERQIIYQELLYPTPAWQALIGAIEDQACELADELDHTSRRTLLRGPPSLDVLKASHSVVESETYFLNTQAAITVYIITTEPVPPID